MERSLKSDERLRGRINVLLIFLLIPIGSFAQLLQNTQTITTTGAGTFTMPPNINSVIVECWGGGGAGAGHSGGGSSKGDGGGGGGGYIKVNYMAGSGTVISYFVGPGGVGAPIAGISGQNTWFAGSNSIIAAGGQGGFDYNSNGNGGNPGGYLNNLGGTIVGYFGGMGGGSNVLSFPNGSAGGGGGSSAGNVANGNPGMTVPCNGCPGAGGVPPTGGGAGGNGGSSLPGSNGFSPGGGGGGAGGGNMPGGSGANGQIIISWTQPAAPSAPACAQGPLISAAENSGLGISIQVAGPLTTTGAVVNDYLYLYQNGTAVATHQLSSLDLSNGYTFTGIVLTGVDGIKTMTAAVLSGSTNNFGVASPSLSLTLDTVYPLANSVSTGSSTNIWSTTKGTSASSVTFNVTFSESVTGVDAGDFSVVTTGSVAGATISNVSGSGSSYVVTVNGYTGTGTLGLNFVDNNSVVDLAGNPVGGPAAGDGNKTGQTYSIVLPEPSSAVSSFVAASALSTSITVQWNDAVSPVVQATNYLVMLKQTASAFPAVADGTKLADDNSLADGVLIQNIAFEAVLPTGTATFTGLSPSTSYNLIVYPYTLSPNNSADNIDYKLSPSNLTTGTTPAAPVSSAATNILNTSFSANWSASTGATGYFLDVSTVSNFGSFVTGYNNLNVGNVVTYSVNSGLSPNVTYYYRVRATNANGTSINSSSQTVTTAPVAPVSSAATNVQDVSFTANWSASPGATGYYLDVSTDNFGSFISGFSAQLVTGTSAAVSGLTSNTNYQYRVRATNGSGISANSGTISVLTLPQAPVAIAASATAQTGFTVNWTAITGITSFRLDVSADNFATLLSSYNDLAVTGTSQAVTGVTAGTTYSYRLRATNATGPSANSNIISVITVPATPTASAGTAVTTTSFTANWTSSTGTTNYLVDVASDNAFANILTGFNNLDLGGNNSVSITGLSAGTNYYYRVRAKNASGTSGNSNTYNQITVPSAPLNHRTTSVTSSSFFVQWDAVAGAASYEFDVFDLDNNMTVLPAYQAKPVTALFASVTGLLPSHNYVSQVRAVNAGGISASSNQYPTTTADASGTGGGSAGPPQISLGTTTTANGLKAVIATGTGINNTITFYHRKITEAKFTKGSTAGPVMSLDVTYDPSADFDDIGMEYYFKAKDAVGRVDSTALGYVYRSASNLDVKSLSGLTTGGTLESYRIFAIPLKLTSENIDDIFNPVIIQYGGYDKTKWRLVHYQNGQNVDYKAGLQKIEQGRGYWYNSMDAVSITVSGTSVEANQTNGGFSLTLDPGYTQIGNPYTFDINWNDVLAKNGNPAGVGKIYVYNPSGAGFKETDVLPAWQGGFVKNTGSSAVTVKIPVNVKRTAGRAINYEIASANLGEQEWMLPLKISLGKAWNDIGGIGMSPMALKGNDRFDEQSLPRFIKYLELNSYHNDFFMPRFTRDVVPSTDQYNWDFEVESNFGAGTATLSWDAKSLGSNDAQLLLYDEVANAIVDMKRVSEYSFELNDKYALRFMYSSDARNIQPGVTGLGRPWPNPFTSSVTVPFITSSDTPEVEIALYDLTGRKIRTLVSGTFEAGYHECTWDGSDDQGSRAAPGLYVYRLAGSNVKVAHGRLVLK